MVKIDLCITIMSLLKRKYPDIHGQQKVKNAPVRYFSEQHANAWDDRILKC